MNIRDTDRTLYPPCIGLPSNRSIHRKLNFLIKSKASPYVRYPLWGGVKLMFYINSNWSFVAVLSRSQSLDKSTSV